MNPRLVDRVADAVLYEGYLLYPYRPSSVKNRQRWTFGGLFPRDSGVARTAAEPCSFRAECLVEGGGETAVRVRLRFLHLILRSSPVSPPWQEAQDREVEPPEFAVEGRGRHAFAFPGRADRAGDVLREQHEVRGAVEWAAVEPSPGLFRLAVTVTNLTPPIRPDAGREELLPVALVSAHAILEVRGGDFVSLLDPPEVHREHAAGCKNVGVWPVLVGEPGERHTVLASPIILYDHPRIAPESPGDLFDATEIDEILTLRILTMTDDEKREMRAADPRADALLTRTESLAREELMRLHGTVRGLRPVRNEGDSP